MSSLAFAPVDRQAVLPAPKGVNLSDEVRPGDFILVHGRTGIARLIRIGQAIRIWGDDRRYTRWNHAALVHRIDPLQGPVLIEAIGRGVVETPLSAYDDQEYVVIQTGAENWDRIQACERAEFYLGHRYGFRIIAGLVLGTLTGGLVVTTADGQQICSGLVALCQLAGDANFTRQPSHVMPADLAKYYEVGVAA